MTPVTFSYRCGWSTKWLQWRLAIDVAGALNHSSDIYLISIAEVEVFRGLSPSALSKRLALCLINCFCIRAILSMSFCRLFAALAAWKRDHHYTRLQVVSSLRRRTSDPAQGPRFRVQLLISFSRPIIESPSLLAHHRVPFSIGTS